MIIGWWTSFTFLLSEEFFLFFFSVTVEFLLFLSVTADFSVLQEVAAEAGVTAMPTFQVYVDGKKIAEMVGASEGKLEALFQG